MPSREFNYLMWNEKHEWPKDGDEWSGQAKFCKVPYDEWKDSIYRRFIKENLGGAVLEIGPGHGRWTGYLTKTQRLVLVDMSPNCISFCKKRFSSMKNIDYHVNDGKSLPVQDSSIDFIWSFDTFVHIERDTLEPYLAEFARVLKPSGRAVIHHPGRRHLWLAPLASAGVFGKMAYDKISLGMHVRNSGWRANISRELFRKLAEDSGLEVLEQTDSWGKCGVRLFSDCVSTLRKP